MNWTSIIISAFELVKTIFTNKRKRKEKEAKKAKEESDKAVSEEKVIKEATEALNSVKIEK